MQPNPHTDHSDGAAARLRRAWWLGPFLVLLVVAALAAASGGARPEEGMRPNPQAGATAGSDGGDETHPYAFLERRDDRDPTARGPIDAPVVMIEYADFQCPFCGRFARDTEPRLIADYVDRGLLRIEWRDLPYLGPESRAAAAAARAAGAQGRFWEFHDALYAQDRRVNSGALDDAALRRIAERIGLDLARFDADRASAAVQEQIARDEREAGMLGITGTPAFIVGGTPIIGAQPYEVFQQVIDEALGSR
ncbi:MAG TPA: thioredoxin domain-containing protein [Micromonosporaceae bacterium]